MTFESRRSENILTGLPAKSRSLIPPEGLKRSSGCDCVPADETRSRRRFRGVLSSMYTFQARQTWRSRNISRVEVVCCITFSKSSVIAKTRLLADVGGSCVALDGLVACLDEVSTCACGRYKRTAHHRVGCLPVGGKFTLYDVEGGGEGAKSCAEVNLLWSHNTHIIEFAHITVPYALNGHCRKNARNVTILSSKYPTATESDEKSPSVLNEFLFRSLREA
jgi:hypothetical protein